MNLYEIDMKIMECIDEETGEILDEEMLDSLEMEKQQKIENIACWIKNLVAESEALKAEKMAFAERQKRAENKAESLKKYLASSLGGQKFETPKVSVSFRKSEAVEIENEDVIPEKYKKVKYTPDKTSIKQALKTGVEIEGAILVTKNNINIK